MLLTISLLLGAFLAAPGSINCDEGFPWYHQAIVYQIYPRSFQDSDGDGIGDLKGILQHVDYLGSLGIDAVWLSPIYPSPNKDFGYDISDMTAINPEYGTMDDFNALVQALKSKGIRTVLDYVPNHTSDQHEWFQKSLRGEEPFTDYYIWLQPKIVDGVQKPPNNWTGGWGPMWTYRDERKLMYLHQYLAGQPDLNYRNPAVIKSMQDVLEFWMEKGVSGFRMDSVMTMAENDTWADEPYLGGDPTDSNSYAHTMTTEQPLTYEVLRQFKQTLEEYTQRKGGEPMIMMTESYSSDPLVLRRYYGNEAAPVTTFPFNFLAILMMNLGKSAKDWADTINTWYPNRSNSSVMPGDWAQPNFVLGNHDQHRFASRFTPEYTDILNFVQLTLKGTAVVYAGDELGLVDSLVRRDQGKDIQGLLAPPGEFYQKSRDPQRAPIPWNANTNGGFTTGTPWLPLASDYMVKNVAQEEKADVSHLKIFREAAKLKKELTILKGDCEVSYSGNSLVIIRSLSDYPTIITVVNLDDTEQTVNIQTVRSSFPKVAKVLVKSINNPLDGTTVDSSNVVLPPLAGIIISSS